MRLRASYTFYRMMKELERYFGANYSNRYQPAMMNEPPETFHEPDIPTTIPETVIERPKTDAEMNYLEKKNID